MKTPILTTAAVCFGLLSTMSSADTFHSITDIATPGMVNGTGAGQELNVIEGAGVGFDINPPHDNTGPNWYTTAAGTNYMTGHAGDEKLLFDLGADVVIGEISVWGYAASNGNGLREFNVSFATDAEGGAPGLGDETYGTSIALNPAYTAALNPTPRQSFLFGEAITARYVEVWVTTNYAGGVGGVPGGDRLGVGEIAFAAHTAVGAPDIEVAGAAALALQAARNLLLR
jgi:hypothetical protein